MADQPETTDETTPATDDKDDLVRPAGMNPHTEPENASGEDDAVRPAGMNPHTEPGQTSGESASGE
jgi:hypothetical protein